MSKPHRPPPRPRTTLRLTGTVRQTEAKLDHPSALALAYAIERLERWGSKKVPTSGVVRLALQRYVRHLDSGAAVPSDEVRSMQRVCEVLSTDEEAQQGAWKRLEAAPEGAPLPPWLEVLRDPHAASEIAAFDVRSEALFQELMRERTQRTKARPSPLPTDKPTNPNP